MIRYWNHYWKSLTKRNMRGRCAKKAMNLTEAEAREKLGI